MKFYDSLQLDPAALKQKIKQSPSVREKWYFGSIMVLRGVLLVSFAVLFIRVLSVLFHQTNTPMAVVLFCILLAIRFVNFEYRIQDSLGTLAMAMLILLFVPRLVPATPVGLIFFLHLFAFFPLIAMTSQRPELGNGGLYGFAYIYLVGNPVQGEIFVQRAGLVLAGYILCAIILILKHRHKHSTIRFQDLVGQFSLSNPINLWQVRLATGVSLALTMGSIFHLQQFIWMGFACSSLLSQYPYSPDTRIRFGQRMAGVIIGSGLFVLSFQMMQESLHPLLGPLGGLCLSFCTDYRNKTALNCFGALMAGSAVYGLQSAVILRIVDTMLGVAFGTVFAWLFHQFIAVRFIAKENQG